MALGEEFRQFFEYFRAAISRLEAMPDSLVSSLGPDKGIYAALDAIILACAYIDTLSLFRYGEGKWSYIGFLETYPSDACRSYFRKMSCLYLDQPPLTREGKPIFSRAGEIRNKLYGTASPDVQTDLDFAHAWRIVKRAIPEVKPRELKEFSYAAYFYEYYRCYGVHSVQIPTGFGGTPPGRPYYEVRAGQRAKLVFPPGFILETLKTALERLEKQVLAAVKAGEHATSANKYEWVKAKYGVQSRFIETRLKYGWSLGVGDEANG